MKTREIVNTFFTFAHEEISAADADKWKDLGFNAASTFIYNPKEHSAENFKQMLDRCYESGIKVLVSDERVSPAVLLEDGKKKYRDGINAVFAEYGFHPAVMGFFLVDEPSKPVRDKTVDANLILLEKNPKLKNCVNFLPYDGCERFTELQGCLPTEYEDVLTDIITRGKFTLFGTDHYGPFFRWGKKHQTQQFFKNLNMCGRISEKTGADCWFGTVCFGHMNIKDITYTDLLWQQSVVFMYGLSGVNWYKLYDLNKKGLSAFGTGTSPEIPVNVFGETGGTYDDLRTVTRLFNEKFKHKFEKLRHIKTWHYLDGYADTPIYFPYDDEHLIRFVSDHGCPAIISKFENIENGSLCYGIMNMDMENNELFKYTFDEKHKDKNGSNWLRSGEMMLIEL